MYLKAIADVQSMSMLANFFQERLWIDLVPECQVHHRHYLLQFSLRDLSIFIRYCHTLALNFIAAISSKSRSGKGALTLTGLALGPRSTISWRSRLR